jgi:hypothetical protein
MRLLDPCNTPMSVRDPALPTRPNRRAFRTTFSHIGQVMDVAAREALAKRPPNDSSLAPLLGSPTAKRLTGINAAKLSAAAHNASARSKGRTVFKHIQSVVGLSLFALTAAAGCTEAPMTEEDIGQNQEALCANGDGVNSAMAALAVAAAKELGRWHPTVDFAPGRAAPWFTTLTATGKARCADGRCWNTQAVLDLQKAPPNSVKFGNVVFNANNFVSTLTARWNEQKNCELRGGTGDSNCTAEQHKLTFKSSQPGACDTIFTFDAKTPTGGNLVNPQQLKNKLMFVGYPSNPFLAFSSTGTTVSIDPTYGLNPDATTTTGTCAAACTKISATSIAGQCCSCAGASKKFVKATFNANTFLCQ